MTENCLVSEINQKLEKIMEYRFEINMRNFDENSREKELLGDVFRLEARDMIYLFFDIEKEFGITIPEEDIVNGKFATLNSISGIINEQLKMKEGIK